MVVRPPQAKKGAAVASSRVFYLLATVLFVLVSGSCARERLADVPAFNELGFRDSLEVVERQVRTAYEVWQEKPLNAGRNGHLGMLLAIYGRHDAAEILYRRARTLAPDEFRWTYYLAVALMDMGRYEEAAEMFRAALDLNPKYAEARIQLARLLFHLNETEESAKLYREITVEFPARVEGWLGLGKALAREGDHEAAVVALRRAREAGPHYGEVRYALASALAASGDDDGAAVEFAAYERTAGNKIHMRDPLMTVFRRLNASDTPHMVEADHQLRRGQTEDAVDSFRAAIALNPVNQDAWGGLIFAQSVLGEIDQAGQTYHQALAEGISNARLHLTYGQALLKAQQLDAARSVIGKAIELDPHYVEALAGMGQLEMLAGNSGSAGAYFDRALSQQPNNRDLSLALARALIASGQFQEAVVLLEPLTADPSAARVQVLKALAMAYYGLERENEAIDTLQKARDAAPRSVDPAVLEELEALEKEWRSESE